MEDNIILIITPVFRAYDCVKRMCDAIDQFTVNPYLHVLVDDDSGITEPFPVSSSQKRRVIMLKREYEYPNGRKNGLGQVVQLGYDYAHYKFENEIENKGFDHIFMIESDVVVKEEWDKKQIEVSETLPEDWATLDVQSVNEQGNITYPTTHSNRLGYERDDLELMEYPDFQCTLFNNEIFKSGIKFSDFPSHFDILFGRKVTEITKRRHFRTKLVSALHINGGGASRQYLK